MTKSPSTTDPNRTPAGVAAGGEFAVRPKGEVKPSDGREIGGKPAPVEPRRPEMTDRQRWVNKLRGHNFMPPKAQLKKLPPLGTHTDTPIDEIPIHQHYFARSGVANWYVAEYDPASGMAWGYADVTGSTGEWGEFHMVELESLLTGHSLIERDCHFSAATMPTILDRGY